MRTASSESSRKRETAGLDSLWFLGSHLFSRQGGGLIIVAPVEETDGMYAGQVRVTQGDEKELRAADSSRLRA
jgi:hypothetical protein